MLKRNIQYGPSMMSQDKEPHPSVGVYHLKKTLKFQFTAFEGSFQVKYPHRVSFQGIFTWNIIDGP